MKTRSKSNIPNLYYLNPLFDLSLGNYPISGLEQSAKEMSTLFIPVAGPTDKVLLDVVVPEDFVDYLSSCGLKCPGITGENDSCRNLKGLPWGWSRESVNRLEKTGAQCFYPDLSVVKEVNSRKFSFIVNQSTNTGVPGAQLLESMKQLYHSMKSWQQFPYVIKPLFGNAGYGFVRRESSKLTEGGLKQVELFFNKNNGVIIEPWYNRCYDISSKCSIDHNGNIEDIRHHRTLSNSAGTFIADWIDRNDTTVNSWRDTLDKVTHETAVQLFKKGYFGPVGFDSFIWEDQTGAQKLAPIIEINARHPMSSIAYALHDKLTPNKVATFRFISKKRHKLPDNYESLLAFFGKDAFHQETREGIILVTPLRLSHDTQWVQPARSAFFIAANSSAELLAIDKRLRRVLSR